MKQVRQGWAGGEPRAPSRGNFVGPLKALSLLLYGPIRGQATVALTPTDWVFDPKFKGGIRINGITSYIAAGSAWGEIGDQLMAIIMMYTMSHNGELKLHHVGKQHPFRAEMFVAVRGDEQVTGREASWPTASDHVRAYTLMDDGHYNEQTWRPGQEEDSFHWDVETPNPEAFLTFVAKHLGVEVKWLFAENGPVGVVWIVDGKHGRLGIMARKSHWEIPHVAKPSDEEIAAFTRRVTTPL